MHSINALKKKKTLGRVKICLVPPLGVELSSPWGRREKILYFEAGKGLLCAGPFLPPTLSPD